MTRDLLTPRAIAAALLLLALALLPAVVHGFGLTTFYITLTTRILILTVAAISLNIILGYGGMVSFGHAVYIGIGGYAVGISAFHGLTDGTTQWAIAIGASALAALGIGAISLRTRGVYFIMITLAFAQMIYYVAVGLQKYGGDDGLTLRRRSDFGEWLNLRDRTTLYYVAFVVLLAVLVFTWRFVNSRFGHVLQGIKSNERRMRAIGFPTFRYRLVGFVIAGAICGLAGALLANQTNFISPAMMHWTRSGDLIVIVVLGGMGSLFGPVFGAIAFLLLEEYLPNAIDGLNYLLAAIGLGGAKLPREAWQIVFGPMLLLLVIFARRGIDGLLDKRERSDG
jgi:branched-chain amino acid transport system permease protein